MVAETTDHRTLSRLVAAGTVRDAYIVGRHGGWALMIRDGMQKRPLAAQRSRRVRLFRRFETLVAYLKGIGIAHFNVDAGNFEPDPPKTTRRPDHSEASKCAHEATAYDAWFREQVQVTIDDPRPSIPHADVMAAAQTVIDGAKTKQKTDAGRRNA